MTPDPIIPELPPLKLDEVAMSGEIAADTGRDMDLAAGLGLPIGTASRLRLAVEKARRDAWVAGAKAATAKTQADAGSPRDALRAALIRCGASQEVAEHLSGTLTVLNSDWSWEVVAISTIARIASRLRGEYQYVSFAHVKAALADVLDPTKPLTDTTCS